MSPLKVLLRLSTDVSAYWGMITAGQPEKRHILSNNAQ